ncbi:hypothetical protein DH2020_029831 [Rehmannia glutinosa]|uniref:AUGMIN subunit 8 n=1 Tax=Rehmannia glutinosa TaxID=99300 RepID=A0ABR0VPZ4_REHGL
MDVSESKKALEKKSTAEITRTTHTSRTREVSSRYKSPTPSAANGSKRCPSPNVSRTSSTSTVSVPKRALSAERKRPSTPSRPPSPSPSTPVRDTTAEMVLASRKTASDKLPESLWPSTMRSLSISFQSDTISDPIVKKEKTVSPTPSDRTLRPSSNVGRKGETPLSGKPTPERKRSPLKGKNSADQLENSKPVDSLNARLLDRHQWRSRTIGKVSTSLNTDKMNKNSSLPHTRMVTPSVRRLSLDGTSKPLPKSASDLLMQISRDDSVKEWLNGNSVDDRSLRTQRPGSSSSSDRTSLVNGAARALSLPTPGSRPPSPSVSRGVSPSRARAATPSSRGTSPARVRPSSPSRNPQNSSSVLSFIVDIKKGKKAANNVEDVHQLRLLYNRHLQWRFANARSDAALNSQKAKAEKMLYSVWNIIVDLWDSVMEKRSDLQQLKLKLKLYSVLDNQMSCQICRPLQLFIIRLQKALSFRASYPDATLKPTVKVTFLDEWTSMERDHTNSLTWAIQDLQASTVRIPVTGGARADVKTVEAAVCSAVDVMNSMGSTLCSILSQIEGMNCLVSELADVAAHERAMLDECESLLGSTAALQMEEYSLRTHLLQMKQAWRNGEQSRVGIFASLNAIVSGSGSDLSVLSALVDLHMKDHAYASKGSREWQNRFFNEMQELDIRRDPVTFTSILSACAQLGALGLGKWVHDSNRSDLVG